jgi:hypothetical protein
LALRGFVHVHRLHLSAREMQHRKRAVGRDTSRLGALPFTGGLCLAEASAAAILRSAQRGVMERQHVGRPTCLFHAYSTPESSPHTPPMDPPGDRLWCNAREKPLGIIMLALRCYWSSDCDECEGTEMAIPRLQHHGQGGVPQGRRGQRGPVRILVCLACAARVAYEERLIIARCRRGAQSVQWSQ